MLLSYRKGGKTVMMYAAMGGHVSCLELLFRAGADIEARNDVSN